MNKRRRYQAKARRRIFRLEAEFWACQWKVDRYVRFTLRNLERKLPIAIHLNRNYDAEFRPS